MKPNYQNDQATKQYQKLLKDLSSFPFSFTYNHKEYCGFSEKIFVKKSVSTSCKNGKETHTVTLSLAEELSISLVLSHYASHGVTEWTVWFENPSDHNSAIL